MFKYYAPLRVAVLSVMAFTCVQSAYSQDNRADQAKALLDKGAKCYKALDYRQAKSAFLKVDAEALSKRDKASLNDHLAKVDTAIRMQSWAIETLKSAQDALKDGKLSKAKELYAKAASCPHLKEQFRKIASRQVSQITKKQQAVASSRTKAKPAAPAITGAVSAALPAATSKRKKKTSTKASKRMMKTIAARQSQARKLLADAKKLLAENQPAQAEKMLEQALKLDGELLEARKQLTYAHGLLGKDSNAEAVTVLEKRRRVARQRTNMEIDKALAESNEILARADSSEDYKAATDAARTATDFLSTNKELYSLKSYRDKRTLIGNLIKHITMKQETWQRQRAQQQREEIQNIEHDRVTRQQRQRRGKITSLTMQARALRSERKFKPSLETIERILSLDPKNRWAAEQKETLTQFVILMDERGIVRTRNLETQKVMLANKQSEIPWWSELIYPRDWKDITQRRQKYGVTATLESEQDRKVRTRLREMKIKELNFDDIELKDVIQFLRDVSGVNLYVKWNRLAPDVTKETTVNVHLMDVTLAKALKVILEDVASAAPLGYVLSEGVIKISTTEDLATDTVTRVYDIRDLVLNIPSFIGRRLNLEASGDSGSDSSSDSGGDMGFGDEEGGDTAGGISQDAADIIGKIITLFKETISPESWTNTSEVGIRNLRGHLVITQTAENHQKIVDLLGQLRQARAIQISIEARFIEVQSSFLERIGVELSVTLQAGENERWTALPTIGQNGVLDWAHGGLATEKGLNIGTDTVASLVPSAINIAGTFLDDIQVDFLIEATQAHAMARLLTAPRITLFNGQRAFVSVTEQETYLKEFEMTTTETDGVASTDISIETDVMNTGTMLDVEATVSDDRRYVTLTLRPQVATGELVDLTIEGGSAENPFTSTIGLPTIQISEIQTTVMVPDGGTLLLGGLKQAGERERELGVPLLSKVPIINRLFTNRGMARDDQTLLILVKPKIIIHAEAEDFAHP